MMRVSLPLILAALLTACSGGTPANQGASSDLPAEYDADIGEIIATVNGFPVGAREFEQAALRVAPANGESFTDEEKREIVEDLVTEKMLYLHARSLGLDRDPKVQTVMVNTLLRDHVYDQVRSTDFSEEELRAYYDAHTDEFVVPEKREVLRILIRTDRDRTPEEALSLATDLYERIVEDPTRFRALALEHSEDPYRRRGGNLGFLDTEGKPGIDPEVVAKAFELDIEGVSEPFEAGNGYNVIFVRSRREPIERTFAQMKSSVLRKVKAEKYRELYDSYVSGIEGDFSVELDDAVLGGLNPRPAMRGPAGRPADFDGVPGMDDEDEGEE